MHIALAAIENGAPRPRDLPLTDVSASFPAQTPAPLGHATVNATRPLRSIRTRLQESPGARRSQVPPGPVISPGVSGSTCVASSHTRSRSP